MRRRTDEEIQAFLERLVSEALAEDPGYALPAGFADEVAARVTPRRKRFPWFEAVVTPALLAAAAAAYVPRAVAAWIAALQQPDSGARAVLDTIEAGRPDLVLGAVLVLGLLAVVDRAFRKIAPTVRTA